MSDKKFIKRWYGKFTIVLAAVIILGFIFFEFFYEPFFEWYTGVENGKLTYDSSVKLGDKEFEMTANEVTYETRFEKAKRITINEKNETVRQNKIDMLMNTPSFIANTNLKHINYFREAGIRQYEGPKTCLTCHETMKVRTSDGTLKEVNTMDDIVNSVHFKFQTKAAGFSTYGYDGRRVNDGSYRIPVGKIDRACGIPGSFSWTGWAELIETKPETLHGEVEMRSEGCGQCHIGGNYQPATEKMMPIGDVPGSAKEGIDCLICHSQNYDMNYRYVIKDEVGTRWNQDRTMKAAMSVTKPKNENCLYCHQHNMGGDQFTENKAVKSLGYKNKRLVHGGSKRANPFSHDYDVHYAAGLVCTDCHVPEGHKIPRGTKGTDLVANDLPDKEVSCENCHTLAPHSKNDLESVMLNGHTAKIACETCHIRELEKTNVVLRDWTNPVWNEEEGIYTPTDILRSGKPNIGFTYLWFNGNGTFLANALGNNPDGDGDYNPLMSQITTFDNPVAVKETKENIEKMLKKYNINIDQYMKEFMNTLSQMTPEMIGHRKEMIERNIKPLQDKGKSKIYPFKLFNAKMFEDMNNHGPFGAMILPFDYPTYYQTGKPAEAVKKALNNPIVQRMYQYPFKEYMMDEFMKYFGVKEWSTEFPIDDNGKFKNVKKKWMRQYGTLMVNHGIVKNGRTCVDCHTENGILDFEKLGYTKERANELRDLPELSIFASRKSARLTSK